MDYEHYLTCVLAKYLKATCLKSVIIKLDTVYTPPSSRYIIHSVDTYYKNEMPDELLEFNNPPSNFSNIKTCIQQSDTNGWGHFIRSRIFKSL